MMHSPRTRHLARFLIPAALAAVLAAACGDDGGSRPPDAMPIGDAGPDAPEQPGACDFTELANTTNDIFADNGTAEITGLSLTTKRTICGKINGGDFDVDAYQIQLPAAASVLVRLSGDFGEVESALVAVMSGDGKDLGIEAIGSAVGNYAATAVTLPAGTYSLVMIAERATVVGAEDDYKLSIEIDMPDARCGALTTAADYVEANDGATHDGNDMVEVRFDGDPERALTAAADSPEPSGITTGGATKSRITGTMGDVNAADEYRDRDAYLITTGDHDQLTVRVAWTGDTADLDLFVFPAGELAEIESSTRVSTAGPEFATFAVPRNAQLWLWVGAYDDATALPVDYDITVCGESFTP